MTPLLQLFKMGLPVKQRTCCITVPCCNERNGGEHP